jgi:membrane-bound lytic murein transglycosylase A
MMLRSFLIIGCVLSLAACSGGIIPPSASGPPPAKRPQTEARPDVVAKPVASMPIAAASVTAPPGTTARTSGVFPAPLFDALPYDSVSATRALKAFRISCPSLIKRSDASGLTRADDWKPACAAAASWPNGNAVSFFGENFEMAQIGEGKAFATGYYEPEIAGSRTQSAAYPVPVYKRPAELVEIDLGQFSDGLKGKKIRGKVSGLRSCLMRIAQRLMMARLPGAGWRLLGRLMRRSFSSCKCKALVDCGCPMDR